mmetsp:Transcript_126285/g.365556  ORF Transcript_126285/g.365556 Transcript_126285/m.365556 type:complete len:229 (+) Transcript_126285:115-801(+)
MSHIVWGQLSISGSDNTSSQASSKPPFASSPSEVEYRNSSSSGNNSSSTPDAGRRSPIRSPNSRGSARIAADEETADKSLEAIIAASGFWSIGSERHGRTRCQPCRFVYSRSGCSNGAQCFFCHLPHTNHSKNRLGMSRREYCRSMAQRVREACEGKPEAFDEIMRKLSAKSDYLGSLLEAGVTDMEEEERAGHSTDELVTKVQERVCAYTEWSPSAAMPRPPTKVRL